MAPKLAHRLVITKQGDCFACHRMYKSGWNYTFLCYLYFTIIESNRHLRSEEEENQAREKTRFEEPEAEKKLWTKDSKKTKKDMVAHTCNPNTSEAQLQRWQIICQPGLISDNEILSQKGETKHKLRCWHLILTIPHCVITHMDSHTPPLKVCCTWNPCFSGDR